VLLEGAASFRVQRLISAHSCELVVIIPEFVINVLYRGTAEAPCDDHERDCANENPEGHN
jgi:hypothetical protein